MTRRLKVEAPWMTLAPEDKGGYTVVQVFVQIGKRVKTDEVVAELETTKATLDVRSPADGVVESLAISRGDFVLRGAPLLTVRRESAPE